MNPKEEEEMRLLAEKVKRSKPEVRVYNTTVHGDGSVQVEAGNPPTAFSTARADAFVASQGVKWKKRPRRSAMWDFCMALWVLGLMYQVFALWAVYHDNTFGQATTYSVIGLGFLVASSRRHW